MSKRKFEVGMWVDAKDTIDQWLEAQITNMSEEQVYVHYNGWGNRWDEWLSKTSPRLALFRTHTVQNPKANYLSPVPNIMPDQRLPNQQFINHSLSTTVNSVTELVARTMQQLTEFAEVREKKNRMLELEEEKVAEVGGDALPTQGSSLQQAESRHMEEEKKEEQSSRASQRTRQNNMYLIKADSDAEVIHRAA